MAILHGNWVQEPARAGLFVWGETWRQVRERRKTASLPAENPYALGEAELAQALGEQFPGQTLSGLPFEVRTLKLPAAGGQVLYSASPDEADRDALTLEPFAVGGLWLTPHQAFALLNAVPLGGGGTTIGPDLRFWSQCSRWVLDLMARAKYLPGLEVGEEAQARWVPLLDAAADQARLKDFASRLPGAARAAVDHIEPVHLVRHFLGATLDAQVRTLLGKEPPDPRGLPAGPVKPWLLALTGAGAKLRSAEGAALLAESLETWTAPLFYQGNIRTCFRLLAPAQSGQEWTLEFLLQVGDDDSLLGAGQVWSSPAAYQETFLAGLGLASRLYPPIERA